MRHRASQLRKAGFAVGLSLPVTALPWPSYSAATRAPEFGTQNWCDPYTPITNIRYYFSGPFTSAERNIGRDAFEDWRQVVDNASNSLYTSAEVAPGNHNVEVRRVASGGSYATCGDPLIVIDNPILRTFRHEIGHKHGLNHVGPSHDLETGFDPTMDGCGSGTAIRADDHANALYRRSSGRITPNGGFENGYAFGWSFPNGGGSTYTSNPYQGARSLQLASEAVASTQARVVTSPGTLRARVTYKHSGSTSARYKFEYRGAPHASGTPGCGNAWAPGNIRWDLAPAPGAWTVRMERYLGATSSWASVTSAIDPPTSSSTYASISPRGIDYQLSYFASNATNFVDNIEVYRG